MDGSLTGMFQSLLEVCRVAIASAANPYDVSSDLIVKVTGFSLHGCVLLLKMGIVDLTPFLF